MALPPQLLHALENIKFQAKDALWALSSCICQQSAKIKINGRTCTCQLIPTLWSFIAHSSIAVQIIKVLGEGGFSFVYLAQDEHSGVSTRSDYAFAARSSRFRTTSETICTQEDSLSGRK